MKNILYENLCAEMGRNRLGVCEMARRLGWNRDTLSRKLSGKSPLSLREAVIIWKTFFPNVGFMYLYSVGE